MFTSLSTLLWSQLSNVSKTLQKYAGSFKGLINSKQLVIVVLASLMQR